MTRHRGISLSARQRIMTRTALATTPVLATIGLLLLAVAGCSRPAAFTLGNPPSPGAIFIGSNGSLRALGTATGKTRSLLSIYAKNAGSYRVEGFWASPNRTHVAFLLVRYGSPQPSAGSTYQFVVGRFGRAVAWTEPVGGLTLARPIEAGWSPDGRNFACVHYVKKTGGAVLRVFDARAGKAKTLLSIPRWLMSFGGITTLRWLGSDRILVNAGAASETLSGRHGRGLRPTIAHLDGRVFPANLRSDEDFAVAKYGAAGIQLLRRYYPVPPRPAGGDLGYINAAWSPDRRTLAFVKRKQLMYPGPQGRASRDVVTDELWVVGKGRRPLLLDSPVTGSSIGQLAWARDGRTLFYWLYWKDLAAARARGKPPLGEPVPSFRLNLMSVHPDGTGRKTWVVQQANEELAQSLAAR